MIKVSMNIDEKEIRRLLKKEADTKTRSLTKKIVEELREATPVDTGEARDGWTIAGNTIYNNVPHVPFLNSGSSSQAPTNFIERVLLSFGRVRGAIVR